jgi:transposase-like protein
MKNVEVTCPHCGNNLHIKKNGHYRGEQVYRCSKCSRTFRCSNSDKRIKYPAILRKLAITMYLNGTSLTGIQKILSISFNIKIYFKVVNDWIKNSNSILEQEKKRREEENPPTGEKTIIPIVEMDELFTFIKKNREIKKEGLTLINEYGLLWIGSEMKLLHLR